MRLFTRAAAILCISLSTRAAETVLTPLDSLTGISETYGVKGSVRSLELTTDSGTARDGKGALKIAATSAARDGNQYYGAMVKLTLAADLTDKRLLIDIRSDTPGETRMLYVRGYNTGEKEPAWSMVNWGGPFSADWKTVALQPFLPLDGFTWEPKRVGTRKATAIDRLEFIIGTNQASTNISACIDNVRVAPKIGTLQELSEPVALTPTTQLVANGTACATILHPDSPVGLATARSIADAIRARTGVELPVRMATEANRQPKQTTIMIGTIDNNPALLLLYARRLTPVDSVCPGIGGALVHTVFDPFGKGANVIVLGAADQAGMEQAARTFNSTVAAQPKAPSLTLPRLFERHYGKDFLERYRYANANEDPKRLEQGMKQGQRTLDRGKHCSIAGDLRNVATRYQLTGHSVEAKLFVALWDLYAKSAVADARTYGGPWGFDSDFPSPQVVAGWDNIEHDPALTDAERLRVTKAMGRWLTEAVIPKCAGAVHSKRLPHNHQTHPGLGALFAGLYYSKCYPDMHEGSAWLAMADAIFKRQARYYKPEEDCNGYQWLTNGHLMRYTMTRPDFTLYTNGNGRRIVDYCLGTMDSLGYQVPYGDTGSWKCWNSEMICLDIFSYVTRDPAALWAAALKRKLKGTRELYAFYQAAQGSVPDSHNGVIVWPLEPVYRNENFRADKPPLDVCFDKISFREAIAPEAAHLLLDGLSNGGHKHLDGNSLPRLTQFNRIWLADNDYYKAPVKYHNSMMIFKDGESGVIPPYAELMGAGETPRYGFSRTRLNDYAGADWDRTVVWLKQQKAFVVLDRLVASESSEYQFRVLWHGVGAVERTEDGMLLSQKGPSLRVQLAPGPAVSVVDDPDLGKNWAGYPHADHVVRSLSATATVQLQQGQTYLYGTALHGTADGSAPVWSLKHLDKLDGILVQTDRGPIAIVLGPALTWPGEASFACDAQVVVADGVGLSALGCRNATCNGKVLHASDAPTCVDLPRPGEAFAPTALAVADAHPNLTAGTDAKPHPVVWEKQPAPKRLVLSGNSGLPGSVDLGVTLTSDPSPAKQNVFNPKAPNTPEALLDGKWGNDTTTSVMYEPDKTVTVTLDLGTPCALSRVRWMQWWSTTSSKQTSYLIGKGTAAVSNDAFKGDCRRIGTVTDDGPHPNFGAPIEYTVDAQGATARWVRLTLEPRPGSAVYLAQVLVEGLPSETDVAAAAPYTITATATGRLLPGDGAPQILVATHEGSLLALNRDGSPLWTVEIPGALNDVTADDLNGDGLDEVILARQDCKLSVLDNTGKELWQRELAYYRRPPYVNLVRTGDIDGDGTPEIVAGGENWRFYAYRADGTELWNYESVHPSRSGAVADLDGDGKAEVLCGTHYYWFSALSQDGTRRWRHNFGPICYDVTTGSFDGDKTRGVICGGGDGFVHYLGFDGKLRLKFNTGDEVKRVHATDLDGDGRDEILAGSMSHSLYCFGSDTKRRWRVDLGAPVSALASVRLADGTGVAVAGTNAGRLVTIGSTGKVLAASELAADVVDLRSHGSSVLAATADGKLRLLKPAP